MSLHPVLARQLRRLGLDAGTPPDAAAWQAFLERVDRAYTETDQARYTVERSLDIVSQEMQDLYEDLRLRCESELAEERDRLHAILGALDEGLCVLDRTWRVVLVNHEATRLTGGTIEDALGSDLFRLGWATEAGCAQLRPALRRVLVGRQSERQDLEFRHVSGRRFPVSCSISPVLHDGQVNGVVLVFRDVTEQRQASRDLVHARDVAEAATRAKSEFLAGISHELRTPLNGIVGMTGLLLETELDAAQRDYVSTIRSCGEGLVHIVTEILDFSKIEAGHLHLERTSFDLHELVERAVGVAAVAAHRRGNELISEIAPDVPVRVFGDPSRLLQVLSNLLSNAVRFTERGEVSVQVGVMTAAPDPGATGAHESPAASRLRIEVSDTGIGIAPEALPRLFQSVAPAGRSPLGHATGAGLGLAISHRLVTLMEGELTVRSQVGRGTTFTVVLPLEPDRGAGSSRPERYLASTARVLCVDDNARQRTRLGEQVAALGLRVLTAGDVLGAFDALREAARSRDPFAVVLADADMPGLGGLDLARLMRADPTLASTAVILLSQAGETAPGPDDRAAGIRARLAKPLRRAALIDALGGVLGWSDPADDPAGPRQARPFARASGPGLRVLVAEDDTVNQRVILAQLRRLGLEAVLARNGTEAVEAVAADRYDLVLMDCQMPGMDGFEATRAIRAMGGPASELPIVALTASAGAGDRDRCLAAGMNDHLAKPIDHQRLAHALGRWLPHAPAA